MSSTIATIQLSRWGAAELVRAMYGNGAMALVLNLPDGRPLAKLSVNMEDGDGTPSHELPPEHFYAKDWSENEQIARDCLRSGWFDITDLHPYLSGHVVAGVWKLRAQRGEPVEVD